MLQNWTPADWLALVGRLTLLSPLPPSRMIVKARAYRGQWIVDCPCRSASRLYRFQPGSLCVECGGGVEVEWPSEEMTHGIERLLLMRPDVKTQNWLPSETLIDLMVENGQHGIFTDTPGDLSVDAERIRLDTLPASVLTEFKALA